ncbi:MAG: esterase/lipase family protein [Verrucomicrobiales bacterium]
MVLKNTETQARGQSRELVVIIHAWRSSTAKMGHVRQAVAETLPDADLLIPEYPAGAFSSADPLRITEELVRLIEGALQRRTQQGGGYERIILVGHSLGALLVRKAFVWACCQNQDEPGPLRSAPKAWPRLVERIILMAGTNRGWKIEQRPRHMPGWKWFSFRLAANLHRWFRVAKLINSARRGAPFVVNLRIQWINLSRNRQRIPPTIQLLGTVDDIVEQEDNVDVQSGAEFIYKDVPDTGHANAIDFSGDTGVVRRQVFVDCLRMDTQLLQSDDLPPLERDYSVHRVVFIMHGIRDYGFWTAEVAKHAERIGSLAGEKVKTVISSYGYFPMLGFLLQPERQDNVRWFMDQFTEALARYPNARISFVGHSNGTYLLASALQRYRACFFDQVVFAGSVVPRWFPWDAMLRDKRIDRIQNYVATKDWVVAIFPAVFELFPKGDLGSAGHNGFTDNEGQRYAVRFIDGSHSAALVRENFEVLARFALGDENAAPLSKLVQPDRSAPIVICSKLCPLIWATLLTVVLAILVVPVVVFEFPLWWLPLSAILLHVVVRRI